MMTRRDLLRYLLASPLAATLDVEKLLWVPTPRVVVPSQVLIHPTLAEINRIVTAQILPGMVDRFFQESPFYQMLKGRQIYVGDGHVIRKVLVR